MKLSVIIVSYNVKHFLKQCLHSVLQAAENISTEIICIDNNSIDGSVEMLKNNFPQIKTIVNLKNLGFAKACNQGIQIANGKYILILNPDTVIESDSLSSPIKFMDSHDDAGSLGLKMLDGNGKFLPESKRGLPTPAAAFYKMSGLSKLFYPSKKFGKYYLDHLDKDKIQEVHILTGAYMLIRKTVLDKVGLFDEQFFMYGEDVDLSHRIIKAGFKNIYFPDSRIIHYKGESTKKGTVKYVYTFYKAMLIFSKKHFSTKNKKALSALLNTSIILRAFIALVSNLLSQLIVPLIDFLVLAIGITMLTKVWETNVTYVEGGSYPLVFYQIFIPIYTLIWLLVNYFSGVYDQPSKPKKVIGSMLIGSILILLAYSLLDESLRFSRSIILLGSAWGLGSLISLRFFYRQIGIKKFTPNNTKRVLIIGRQEEAERISDLLSKNDEQLQFLGFVSPDANKINHHKYLGSISKLDELIQFYNISELIFSSKDIGYHYIIDKLMLLKNISISCKIASEEGYAIIGSNSITSAEDFYLREINVLTNKTNSRLKRLFDILISFILICTIPINIFLISNFSGFLKNIFFVLANKKTWVGFNPKTDNKLKLPILKNSILYSSDGVKKFKENQVLIDAANINYAQNYSLLKDLHIIYMGFNRLGRN